MDCHVGLRPPRNDGMKVVFFAVYKLVYHETLLVEASPSPRRHCEERSDVAIHSANDHRLVHWIAASAFGLLAMTEGETPSFRQPVKYSLHR